MLGLKDVVKIYPTGQTDVEALKGVSINFRKSEFVSILGQSGCGKTTLLNIIGGLDRFTSGDLIINGKSTKKFKDRDWDTYRNHSVGFVFQSYNLIPHQTVLKNVELALTLSGIKKAERRRRAIEALEKVGLSDQLHKKPNQMSGGQMQRVAIARAIVNDPDILLADEPTGALDTQTSIQVMEILKEISKDRLIIMVTHNPDLANEYSSRIIKLLDGKVTDDSNPFTDDEMAEFNSEIEKVEEELKQKKKVKKEKLKSMSFFTALSLSFNNLLTKKARTFLTSFAGSIGIIGIALILSLSTGVNQYVENVQRDTLSSYPLTIESQTADMTTVLASMMEEVEESEENPDKIQVRNIMTDMIGQMFSEVKENDLKSFKKFIESDKCEIDKYVSDIQYIYDTQLNVYNADTSDGITKCNPSTIMQDLGIDMGNSPMISQMDVFTQIIGDNDFVKTQFDVVAGKLPEKENEVILMTAEDNQIADYSLYALGIFDIDDIKEMVEDIKDGKDYKTQRKTLTYDEILNTKLKLVVNTDYYQKQDDGTYLDMSEDEEYMKDVIEDAMDIKIVGIVSPKENSTTSQTGGYIGYRPELMQKLVKSVNDSEIVKAQKKDKDTDVFTQKPFKTADAEKDLAENFDMSTLTAEQQQAFAMMSEEQRNQIIKQYASKMVSDATYDGNMNLLGVADVNEPSTIAIYPIDFEAKDEINNIIDDYNKNKKDDDQIEYTDIVGVMMSSVTTIISAVSYILIAFVAISLIVSSIMIGIITYISVLERTKEIGVLRSIGASKKDISRVFNAETIIVGFTAGAIGIGMTLLLLIPINIIIAAITDISGLAQLPWLAGIILVAISVLLTFIAGLFPAKIAAKKDPVVALRTE